MTKQMKACIGNNQRIDLLKMHKHWNFEQEEENTDTCV